MSRVTRRTTAELPRFAVESLGRTSLLASSPFLALWSTLGASPVHWCVEPIAGRMTLLTGVEFGPGTFARFQSLPDGLWTSCLTLTSEALAPLDVTAAAEILAAIARHHYAKTWVFDLDGRLPATEPFTTQELETHFIDVASPGWEPPDATIRSEIRKAEREHIQVVGLEWAEHGEAFMDLQARTEFRHGRTSRYSSEFFRGLAELARSDHRIVWNYCSHQGVPAASHLFLVEGARALHWQVCFDKAFSWLKPNQYILFRTIRELQQRGVTEVSLGATPEGAPGLRAFKEKWGGRPHRYRQLFRASWLVRALGA